MLMAAGRSAPRLQVMGALFPASEPLRASLTEYFIVIVQLSHHIMKPSRKPSVHQWLATSADSKLAVFQSDLDLWATFITEEVNLLTAQRVLSEATENSWLRSVMARRHDSEELRRQLRARKQTLDTCSIYNHEGSWKRTRKVGNSSMYKQSNEYSAWRNEENSSTLLCSGKLGSGKSVLLANIVDDLNLNTTATSTIAYFFCQHNTLDSMKAETVVGSLARQLLHPIQDLALASDYLMKHAGRTVGTCAPCSRHRSLRDIEGT